MAMGIVNNDEFEHELERAIPIPNHSSNITKINETNEIKEGEVVELERPGRNKGDNNVPDALRKMIGESSALDGRTDALALAGAFGISASSVSAYANGSKSTKSYDEQPNKPFIDDGKKRIQSRARKILFQSLRHITPEKLADEKPVVLATIARQMSGIVKEMEPENEAEKNKPLAQFVIMCPPSKSEQDYDVITAREG